jgi:hypothetical protein
LPLVALVAACGSPPKTNAPPPPRPAAETTTKVLSLTLSRENLSVDKVSMRDGRFVPDGSMDLAFEADLEGPATALYLVSCTEKGEPLQGYRADTIVGHEEIPPELGSVIDVGRLTVGIGVLENGKFINDDGGTLSSLPEGKHHVTLYTPNPGTLRPGTWVRLYARTPSGRLVAGPVTAY